MSSPPDTPDSSEPRERLPGFKSAAGEFAGEEHKEHDAVKGSDSINEPGSEEAISVGRHDKYRQFVREDMDSSRRRMKERMIHAPIRLCMPYIVLFSVTGLIISAVGFGNEAAMELLKSYTFVVGISLLAVPSALERLLKK